MAYINFKKHINKQTTKPIKRTTGKKDQGSEQRK